MPKGNPNIKNYSPIVDNSEVDIELNAIMVQNILESFEAKEPDLHKPDEVRQSIKDYFNRCISKGLRPGNMGLYNALGIDKNEAYDITHGRNPRKASVETIQLIKKAQKALAELRENLGSQGKLNPATLIFWQKNFDNFTDVQQIEIAADTMPKAQQTPEEIARQIEQDIPLEADYTVTE